MSIISDDLENHFRAAKRGRRKLAGSPTHLAVPRFDRVLPTVGIEARLSGRGGVGTPKVAFGAGGSGPADITSSGPEVRNPLLSLINFQLPYDRKTLNQWIRYYYKFDPYVRNCTNLNGQFPISDFHFSGTSDAKVLQEFDDLKERCGMLRHAYESSGEEELIGEVFTFWRWDDDEKTWVDYTIMNPDRLDVEEIDWGSNMEAFYSLDPPEGLKNLTKSSNPHVQEMLSQLDPEVLEAVATNTRIPLDSWNVMALVHKDSPYESRGTSPILPAIKALLYKDKLLEAQTAVADQQITPVQLWKIGDVANGYMPNDEQLAKFRALLEGGKHDYNFAIVTHAAVDLELVGFTGKLLPILPELEWCAKQVMIALFTNEATVTGAGPSFGAAIVPFKILQGRYQSKRDRMVELYRRKLLKPFAEHREIFVSTPADANGRIRTSKRVPLVPKIDWNFKLDLTDSAQKMQYAMQLREKSALPMRVICEMLNLDYETTRKALKDEEGSVFDVVYQQARQKRGEVAATAAGAGGGGGGGGPSPAGAESAPEAEIGAEGEAGADEGGGTEEVPIAASIRLLKGI